MTSFFLDKKEEIPNDSHAFQFQIRMSMHSIPSSSNLGN